MPRVTGRRESVANAATDYVLEHGLIGLSLRPLAAALGTSDRMLLYHFEGKDDLVATVLRLPPRPFGGGRTVPVRLRGRQERRARPVACGDRGAARGLPAALRAGGCARTAGTGALCVGGTRSQRTLARGV